jgi:mono/diheme cytochrome c family protein
MSARLRMLMACTLLLAGCANFPSRDPQVWVWSDMKRQLKYKPQSASTLFADGRSSRRPVEGTIAQETYHPDTAYSTGIAADNTYVALNPEPVTKATLERGQAQFDIYCAACHDRTGAGHGIVPVRSGWIAGNLHEERIVKMVDGEIYHVASYGRRTMPGYRFQVAERDRWAIVAYVRALQRASNATINDVPEALRPSVR